MNYVGILVWLKFYLRFTLLTFFTLVAILLACLLIVSFVQLSFVLFTTAAFQEVMWTISAISIVMGFLLVKSPEGREQIKEDVERFL